MMAPLFANAEPISEPTTQEFARTCVERCQTERSQSYCLQTCKCMADEAKQRMTREQVRRHEQTLSAHPDDAAVNEKLERIARLCRQRALRGSSQN